MEAPHKYHLARKPTKLVCIIECLVRTPAGTPTIKTTGFSRFHQSVQANATTLLQIRQQLLPARSTFTTYTLYEHLTLVWYLSLSNIPRLGSIEHDIYISSLLLLAGATTLVESWPSQQFLSI